MFKVYFVRDLDFNRRNLAIQTDNIIKARAIKLDLESKGFYAYIEY